MASTQKHTPRSILEAFYEAERIYMSAPPDKRDFSGIAALVSPDFRLDQTAALPYGGVYNGSEGMQNWAQQMSQYFQAVDVRNPEYFEREGSDKIIVYSSLHLKVRATGEELDYPFTQVFGVDLEQGTMKSILPFYWDVDGLNRAIGYEPKK